MKVKEALTKKLGPMPRWAWIAIAVVVLGYLYYRRQQAAASTDQTATDPYSSYNTQGYVDQGQPYGDTSTAGAYPLGGGLGSGFDPTSFQEGLTYGQGLGTSQAPIPQTDSSVPSDQTPVPWSGNDPNWDSVPADTINLPPAAGPHSVGGGKKGTTTTKKPTAKTNAAKANPSTSRHTTTGGGQQNRKSTTHTHKPATGTHSVTQKALAGGGSSNPGRTVLRNNAPAPAPVLHRAPPPPPPEKKKEKPPPPPPKPLRSPGRR